MPLQLYNTLTRSMQPFEPLTGGEARVYACGPTVYQPPHIGNYRTFLFSDLLHRYLEWKGLDVRFVMNLTDVDDKTIRGAAEQGITLAEFTAPVTEAFFADIDSIGVRQADVYPRATEHVDAMIDLVARLMERGHAYQGEDGAIYYDISSFEEYGKLSGIDPDEVRGGSPDASTADTVMDDEYGKDDVRDFALWKRGGEEDREVGAIWETPWGEGRPGWHLECSVMSMAHLGETLDIHIGGEDLIFPHHEDEIAQSEGATGRPFSRYWLHVKHLKVNGEKMSKSLGNTYSLADLVERGHSLAAVRYLMLSAHYRHELNFTFDGLDDARSALRRIMDFEDRLDATSVDDDASSSPLAELAATALADFERAMDDDLNVPVALAALFTLVREGNAALDAHGAPPSADRDAVLDALAGMDRVLGVVELARSEAGEVDPELAEWVEGMLKERRRAREIRDFARADEIRERLAARGVTVEDTADGTRWKVE